MNAIIQDAAVPKFVEAARRVCHAIETLENSRWDPLLGALTALLAAAQPLAHVRVEPGDIELSDDADAVASTLSVTDTMFFYAVFDPLDQDSVLAVSLRDCLSDIYGPIKSGLRLLNEAPQEMPGVIWEWRNGYQFHWGRHLVDAIRFLVLVKS